MVEVQERGTKAEEEWAVDRGRGGFSPGRKTRGLARIGVEQLRGELGTSAFPTLDA